MKFKWHSQLLVSAIMLSGIMVSPAMAGYPGTVISPPYPGTITSPPYPGTITSPPYPGTITSPPYPGQYPQAYPSTSFSCGWVGGSPATIVHRNGQPLLSPLIVWQTASNDMSPEQRCQAVSGRMTREVAKNGGRLSNLLLTTGKVNGYNVICFVNYAEICNSSNVIMTLLRGENARNPGKVLAQIIRFGKQGGGANVVEGGGLTGGVIGEEEIIPTAVSMEEAVNQLVNESGGMPTAPAPGGYITPAPGGYTAPNPGANSAGGPI